jgi:hypothetical protein
MSIWDAFGKGRYKGFSREAGQLLDKAVELAGGLGCKKADTGHLLWAMLQADGGPAARFLAGKNISELEVRRQLSAGRDGSVTRLARGDMAADLRRAMDYAIIGAQNAHLSRAEPEHLLCAMLEDTDCAAGVMLASMGVQLTEAVRECRQLSGQFILPIQPRSASSLPRGSRASDKYCRDLTRRAADWFDEHLALWALRLIFGLLVAPFLFGLLYSLRRPEPLKRLTRPVEGLSMEAAGPVTVLAVLDVLYAFFLAVQCAALFGGADYLARAGISYASYARSGFFQLVAVAAVNLACLLACLALCKGEGRGLRMVQVLGTLLVAASGVLLVSALWRMNLYVGAYGLSFKRALTYWGMAVLAVLLAAALWKVWHRHFRWFRVLLSVGAAGWLLLNYANVDALVARYNIGRGLDTGAILSASDGRLGALPALEELLEAQPEETELRQAVETLRDSARWQAAHWQTWSVAAWRGQ